MINRVVLTGRLTKDPSIRPMKNGEYMATFTLAVNRAYTGSNGEKSADFINCVVYGNKSKVMSDYGRKGLLVAVEGRITTGSYESGGSRVYTTSVTCDNIQMLEFKNSDTQTTSESTHRPTMQSAFVASFEDDDLPF